MLPNAECEECQRAQEEKRERGRQEAAAALGQFATSPRGAAPVSPQQAARFSPRRRGNAVPAAQAVPVQPVMQAAPTPQPRPMLLLHVYEIIGMSQFDPTKPQAVDVTARRDWGLAARPLGVDIEVEKEDGALSPFYWVRGRFSYEDTEEDNDFNGQAWVTDEADMLGVMHRMTSLHLPECEPPLIRGMLSFCCSMMASTIDHARAWGMGRRHVAEASFVSKVSDAAEEAAAVAHQSELGVDREPDTPMSEAEARHMQEALAQAEFIIRATAASEAAAEAAAAAAAAATRAAGVTAGSTAGARPAAAGIGCRGG